MAMDTASKRSSAIYAGSPWRSMPPIPDGGALTQGDRQQVAFLYAGITGGGAAGGGASNSNAIVFFIDDEAKRRRRQVVPTRERS